MNAYDRYSARARNWAIMGAALVLVGTGHAALSIWGMTNECAELAVYGAGATIVAIGASFSAFERAGHLRQQASKTIKHMPLSWRKI